VPRRCAIRRDGDGAYHMGTTRVNKPGPTGLCSYRAGGVDGSCANHSTVESYTAIYAASSHTYYYYY